MLIVWVDFDIIRLIYLENYWMAFRVYKLIAIAEITFDWAVTLKDFFFFAMSLFMFFLNSA
jgi:hypothetical protein